MGRSQRIAVSAPRISGEVITNALPAELRRKESSLAAITPPACAAVWR